MTQPGAHGHSRACNSTCALRSSLQLEYSVTHLVEYLQASVPSPEEEEEEEEEEKEKEKEE